MLVELSVMEQRYHAVMEVLTTNLGVTEVARRYGVSRQSVHTWVRRYQEGGFDVLAARSHRPNNSPGRLPAEQESDIVELRLAHPRWGPRRIAHELGRAGRPVPARSTVYRVLVRRGLVLPVERRRRRSDYISFQRPAPMELWQMDITGKVFLERGPELKLVTGIDDHSRYCVLAKVIRRQTGRAVVEAFCEAMATYGVPDEVLTDNGTQFTGRFLRPRPAEVAFERLCREQGITLIHGLPFHPTTTGKIERIHQTIQDECLFPEGPFESEEVAQEEIDSWRKDYNTERPHQSLGMATSAERFVPRAPVEIKPFPSVITGRSVDEIEEPEVDAEAMLAAREYPEVVEPVEPLPVASARLAAVELERVGPASGNLSLLHQQIWLGTALAGATVTIWAGTSTIHVLVDGEVRKTVPSKLTSVDLRRLLSAGARLAGAPPRSSAVVGIAAMYRPIELERIVNAIGYVSIANHYFSVGTTLAGRRVTFRLEDDLCFVIADGEIASSMPSPVPLEDRVRIHGARVAGPLPPARSGAIVLTRRLSSRGQLQVGGERYSVGLAHANRLVKVVVSDE
ncbi:MAG TPA: IS481 family transposase, partial [Acidimicrobiales bacterium]|nr:IS481 family transposase [Acidimicrobiales bacterium]